MMDSSVKEQFEQRRHPEEGQWFPDLLLRWVNPLIDLAQQRTLEEKDVWDCPSRDSVSYHSDLFWASWKDECERCTASFHNKVNADEVNDENVTQPSLVSAICRGYSHSIFKAGLLQGSFLLLQLGQPFLVGELVGYIQTGEGGIRRGLSLALGLTAIAVVSSLVLSKNLDMLRRLGVGIRTGAMMAVYEQALRLTTTSRLQNTVGQTTNLIAIDCEKLDLAFQFIHFLWHGPIISLAVMAILIVEIDYAPALAGMAFILVLVPLQNKLATGIGTLRRQMVRFTDERVKLINEMLQAIRVIKLYAWEEAIEQRIRSVRHIETKWLQRYLDEAGHLRELLFCAQPVAALIIFTTAVYGTGKTLTVVQVFRMLAFLNITRFPLNLFGQALKFANDGLVSIKRLNSFFLLPTIQNLEGYRSYAELPRIELQDAKFSWERVDTTSESSSNEVSETDKTSTFTIKQLNFSTNNSNELIAVIGAVGSGKSSFLSAMLGEMNIVSGRAAVHGTVSYCSQTPWIQNLTLRDNVLFGSSIDNDLYTQAINAAALLPDLNILPSGDETEIGERGINLSGGQKARVSLARAFYSCHRSQVYFLDDPFSAVDGNTGNHIFHQGILRLLHDKLRIISLNSHMHLLRHFHRIIVLDKGEIALQGSLTELFSKDRELMIRITGLTELHDPEDQNPLGTATSMEEEQQDITPMKELKEAVSADGKKPGNGTLISPLEISHSIQDCKVSANSKVEKGTSKTGRHLMVTEKVDSGISQMVAYVKYICAALVPLSTVFSKPLYEQSLGKALSNYHLLFRGGLVLVIILFVFSTAQVLRVGVDFYLARLAANFGTNLTTRQIYVNWYYSCFGILIFFVMIRSVFLNLFSIRSSRVLHASILRKVLAAPVPTFFDTHAIGMILNRFSKDLETVDVNVPEFMLQLLINWCQVFAVFALCIWAAYWFALVMIPLAVGFWRVYYYFSNCSRDMKRLESVSRSPIYSSLSETLIGLETIRAYGDTPRFLQSHLNKMDRNQRLRFHLWVVVSWMTVRLELSTSLIICAVSLLSVSLRERVSPIALGLALSFGLQLTALFQRCVQLLIDMATYMTSTERVLDYLNIVQERDVSDSQPSRTIPSEWPVSGSIQFENIWMNYRDNPAVLRGISLSIGGGERVGICGRTGAGKSSIMMALFRIVELTEGHIAIDGVNIANVPLTRLRSSLAIIPQDPVLFTGSIRFQLDPFDNYSDDEVWSALRDVNLYDMVTNLPHQLDESVKENGENLSQGQRQLLCISRALLRQAKILVVDEGTSAVDPYTDDLIQHVLKRTAEEKGTTVLAIAHRLKTIANFDKILVLQAGQVAEFDSPERLLSREDSVFRRMMQESTTGN